MDTSVCPVCGAKHQCDSICPWNFIVDMQSACADYLNERIEAYKTLIQRVAEAEEQRSRKSIIEAIVHGFKDKLAQKDAKLQEANLIIQRYRDININLDVRKQLLSKKTNQLNALKQKLSQLEQMGDYETIKKHILTCNQYLSTLSTL